MIIGIDGSRAVKDFKTGTEHYSLKIIQELLRLAKEDSFRIYVPRPFSSNFKIPPKTQIKVMSFPRLWSQIRLSLEVKSNSPDVLFEPAHTIPVFHSHPVIVTLHDLGFKYFPELYTPFERFYHNFSMNFSARHAQKIIAVSKATAKDLVKFYPESASKIRVIHHGYDKERFFPKDKTIPPQYIQKHQPYFYFIGRLEKKKNIAFLIRVFGKFKQKIKSDTKIVLAGRPGYGFAEIKEEIKKLPKKIKQDIILPGYLDEKESPLWMRNALAFVFPSLFEGFGMPLLEAMGSGVPIIASNSTSIPEVVGDSAILISPKDEKEWIANLIKIQLNSALRQSLIKRGLKRAKNFSWQKAAKETYKVIKEVFEIYRAGASGISSERHPQPERAGCPAFGGTSEGEIKRPALAGSGDAASRRNARAGPAT